VRVALVCVLMSISPILVEAQALRRDCTADEIAHDATWSTRMCANTVPVPAPRSREATREVERPATRERSYTEEHMRLAGYIGAVIAMTRRCGIVPMPVEQVQGAMRAVGLRDRDFTDKTTAFYKRVEEQSSTAEVSAMNCQRLVRMYGPNGTIRAGLVPAR
jgi:hypothetical protein